MKIYELTNITQDGLAEVGGKARGLYQLSQCGLSIARGFVVQNIDSEISLQAAADYYEKSGLKTVAVRSSATAEDGTDFSSAGQYETVLNVTGKSAVKKAIQTCIMSLKSGTVESYSSYFRVAKSNAMCVIIQEMIDADVSGVCFTHHPDDKDMMVVEAVRGLGEQLVSGKAAANSYVVSRQMLDAQGDDLLSTEVLVKIAADAKGVSEKLGMPMDTEWAVKGGRLFWLQARPITVAEPIDPFELDTKYIGDDNVLTTCNVGEMLPGAVTPLSLSTSVASIDFGMRKMIVKVRAAEDYNAVPPGSTIASVGNTLFINLTTVQRIGDYVMGGTREGVELSICGRILKDISKPPVPKVKKLTQVFNGIKYFSLLLGVRKVCRKLGKLAEEFVIPQYDNMQEQYRAISERLPAMDEAFWYHYIASAQSGSMSSALFIILTQKGMEADKANAKVAGVLEDIDGIESVDILRSLRNVASTLMCENPDVVTYSAEQLAEYLKVCEDESAYALTHFIKRHGHRAIREAEMRSKSWHMDDVALCSFLKSVIDSDVEEIPKRKNYQANVEALLKGQKGLLRFVMKYLIRKARQGVVNREYTKSKTIKVLDRFKTAYRYLADLMTGEGLLPESDLIFFLMHDELGKLIETGDPSLVKKAVGRRRVLEEQKTLKFDEICVGKPKPIETELPDINESKVFTGSSISRGKAAGRARVVYSVEDANQLEKGEIMVAAFTDIGWSPYYCKLGALVTEVGSVLSHGAVVAREYALPLVSGIPFATQMIKTGDLISVNGNTGEVVIIS